MKLARRHGQRRAAALGARVLAAWMALALGLLAVAPVVPAHADDPPAREKKHKKKRARKARSEGAAAQAPARPTRPTRAERPEKPAASAAPTSDKHALEAARAAAQDSAAGVDSQIVKDGDTSVKVMSFTGLDIEGRLRSPQLLYFVNRVHAEFERPKLPHRSFMPELERSTRRDPFP
jgi:hypothetical protein